MAPIKVAVINASTVIADAELEVAVAALQTQVHRDFAAAWGIDADLAAVPKGGTPPPGAWWLVILDTSEEAGVLGYHDLTSEGLPLGKVFAKTDRDLGLQWTVTASHELLEMLADPDVNLTVFVERSPSTGTLYAYEACDACQADELAYDVDGVLVSDFVYPAWFQSFRKRGSTGFDHRRRIQAPFDLLPGGYIGVYDVKSGSGWRQMFGAARLGMERIGPRRDSRWTRRGIPRNEWVVSGSAHILARAPGRHR